MPHPFMTLQQMIDALDGDDTRQVLFQYRTPSGVVFVSPGHLSSYRGYYEDLSVEPSLERCNAGVFRALLQRSLGSSFDGYKGGQYEMGPDTSVWLSEWGVNSQLAVVASFGTDTTVYFRCHSHTDY